jgi:hypothetical protein
MKSKLNRGIKRAHWTLKQYAWKIKILNHVMCPMKFSFNSNTNSSRQNPMNGFYMLLKNPLTSSRSSLKLDIPLCIVIILALKIIFDQEIYVYKHSG